MNGRFVQRPSHPGEAAFSPPGPTCGVPVDAEYFDDSSIEGMPETGQEVLLARFELPAQYCGLFQNFAQFIGDKDGWLTNTIDTPKLQWLILINNRPLYPFTKLEHIVNPWGFGGFSVNVRLDENATLEFVVRNTGFSLPLPPGDEKAEAKVGGRIAGRYWYNPAYGDVSRPRNGFR